MCVLCPNCSPNAVGPLIQLHMTAIQVSAPQEVGAMLAEDCVQWESGVVKSCLSNVGVCSAFLQKRGGRHSRRFVGGVGCTYMHSMSTNHYCVLRLPAHPSAHNG